jgi:cobalt-zinc-cadmium efflux system membrane fusion protein
MRTLMSKQNYFIRPVWLFVLTGSALISPVYAVESSNQFNVPTQQLKALGIQTVTLGSTTGTAPNTRVQKSYPAQVVAPPNAEQVISSPVAGLVQQVYVQPNQFVKAGASLLMVASPELGQLQLQLLQANTQKNLAQQTAQRERQLFSEGIIPKRRVQEADAQLQQANASLQYAKSTLQLSGMSTRGISSLVSTGKLQSGITITAAKSGVVSEITAKQGQRIESATALMQVVQTDNLALDIQIPINESSSWTKGTSALLFKGKMVRGRILSTNPNASSTSQTITVKAALEGKTEQIRFGEFLSVSLPVPSVSGGWDLPLSALAYKNSQAYVFVRTNKGFEARPVSVIASAAQRVQVKGKLQAGDQIAITSVVALKGAWLNPKEAS